MTVNNFFEKPILNSPYACPDRHHKLDADGQPLNEIVDQRRRSENITPVPKPKKRKRQSTQTDLNLGQTDIDHGEQIYSLEPMINEIRGHVDTWRRLPNPNDWKVSSETARLLRHWREHEFSSIRPFFCQLEAVETAIWLSEVAAKQRNRYQFILDHLKLANQEANPEIYRTALKMATGAGKTTVMAMLIAWQTVNAVRHPGSKQFSRAFLLIAPGITIRDRLRVLLPNDVDSYYRERELVPQDMLADIERAKIVITNYHAFKRRERLDISKVGRSLLEGRNGQLNSLETEGQMLQRVMPDLMGMKHIVVINDEAHHCYREKPDNSDIADLKGEDKNEAKKNNEAARLWISGIETVKRKLGVSSVYDLSATPFFLSGSGYAEGTLFPWSVSDFSLMDAIECGIVKLPRVPVADNLPNAEMPVYRDLWSHIGKKMPKKGRSSKTKLDPLSLPSELCTALDALYGHYQKTFELWQQSGISVPPVFIVVCNNTASSKLVYDYIAGFERIDENGFSTLHNGRLELFRNYDQNDQRLARPRTLLIDSEQLESGDALDKDFRTAAAPEIEQFKKELAQRSGAANAEKFTDQDLLREVMNTVGKEGRLGESVRCVVSVSMLTEGWDANTVTHILGVRAFGTQLLCEQVVGRALRRQSYELNEENLFNVEYADIMGIPFDFTAKPVVVKPSQPPQTYRVQAVADREACEITFPRVMGYRVEMPNEKITAKFSEDSKLELTPELVGPCKVLLEGIVGESVTLDLDHLNETRPSAISFHLSKHLLYGHFRDSGEEPKLHLFQPVNRIVKQWIRDYLVCSGGTHKAQVLYAEIANMAAELIYKACQSALEEGDKRVLAITDPYNPDGSTRHVQFNTSKPTRWQTRADCCHVNWVVCDSDWEAEFARVAEAHPRVLAYVKNQALGFEVPYQKGGEVHRYLPDFILRIDDGRGDDDPLNLIVEIKGYRRIDAQLKAQTMAQDWIPGVNHLVRYGRWAFAEFTSVFEIEEQFAALIESFVARMEPAESGSDVKEVLL